MNKNRRIMRILDGILDGMYVTFSIVIVVLTVFVCMKPVDNAICYPIIFLLAALLSLANAYTKLSKFSPTHGHSIKGNVSLIVGILLMVLTVISAVSVLR